MPTQNVNLTTSQADFIRECVAGGEYNNASEVVREALRLLRAQTEERQARLELLRAELQHGFDAISAGRTILLDSQAKRERFFDDVIRRGRERLANETDATAAASD